MRKYPKYKSNSVKWLGETPADWSLEKVKFHLSFSKGTNPKELIDENSGEFPEYISVENLRGKQKNIQYVKDWQTCKLIDDNDLLLLWDGANAGEFMKGKKGVLSSTMAKLLFHKKITKEFGWYLFIRYEKEIREVTIGMGIPHVNGQDLKNSFVPIPPPFEQEAIVRFLNYKTGQIDSFIANRQKQIELLKEQRSGIINKAVTKGINPSAKMKDSGIEWIGEIPEHWENLRLKNISKRITNGFVGSTSDILQESGIRYIQALHVKQNTIIFNQPYFVSENWSNEHPRSILKKGDLVITQTGAMTGDVGLVPAEFEGCNCHALIIVKPNIKKVVPEFLLFILSSHFGKSLLESIRTGSMHPHLNSTIVCDINISLPLDILEQKLILDYIKSETSTIDTLTSKYQKQIDLMQEYRTSLISQAVTGKIDLRECEPKKKKKVVHAR